MRPVTEICNLKDCSLRINDLTRDSNQYAKENYCFFENNDLTEMGYIYALKNKYKYSDTVTIDIIVKVTTESSSILTTLVSPHTYLSKDGDVHITSLDENYYSPSSDGYYQIYHLILPVYNSELKNGEKFKELLTNEEMVYYSAAYQDDNVTFYKNYVNSETAITNCYSIAVSQSNVQEEVVSTENIIQVCSDISKEVLDTFVICNLTNCYIKLSKELINGCNFRCVQNNDEELTFKRDFVWMTLNVINYLVEKGDFLEAQRILEKVNTCGGFCGTTSSSSSSSGSGCGCSQSIKKSSGCGCGK